MYIKILSMNKITIKKAIEFDNRTQRGKTSLIKRLQQPRTSKSEGGGDYWIRSLSTVTNACKENDHQLISQKINEIQAIRKTTGRKQTKDMYDRNLQILSNFEDFNFDILKPKNDINYLGGLRMNSVITTRGIPLQVVPSLVFTFKEKGEQKVGATLFIAKLDKFKDTEIAIFCEALYRNLKSNYSEEYKIDRDYCSVVDVLNITILKHCDMNSSLVSRKLNTILKEIRNLL